MGQRDVVLSEERVVSRVLEEIRISNIDPNPFQARAIIKDESLLGLAESIKEVGLLNEVLVRPHPEEEGRFQLVHGARRLRACEMLGWETISVEVRDLTDEQVAEIGLIENLQREDLNPIEEAMGYQMLLDRFGYSITTIAKKMGKSRPYLSNSLRLLKMPMFLKACVWCQTISVSHALAIMGLPEGFLHYRVADLVMDWDLTLAETRQIIQELKKGAKWVSWTRDVPVKGLKEDEALRRDHQPSDSESEMIHLSMRGGRQSAPICVLVTGLILSGYGIVDAAKILGWENIQAVIMFKVAWLRKEDANVVYHLNWTTGEPAPQGIFPEITEEQRIKIKKLAEMLKREQQLCPE